LREEAVGAHARRDLRLASVDIVLGVIVAVIVAIVIALCAVPFDDGADLQFERSQHRHRIEKIHLSEGRREIGMLSGKIDEALGEEARGSRRPVLGVQPILNFVGSPDPTSFRNELTGGKSAISDPAVERVAAIDDPLLDQMAKPISLPDLAGFVRCDRGSHFGLV
jgi:hypothetical protein